MDARLRVLQLWVDDQRAEVTGVDYLSDELYNHSTPCKLCPSRDGVKMKCFNANCDLHFHPLCGLQHEWIEDFMYYWDGEYVTHQDYEFIDGVKVHKTVLQVARPHGPARREGRWLCEARADEGGGEGRGGGDAAEGGEEEAADGAVGHGVEAEATGQEECSGGGGGQ